MKRRNLIILFVMIFGALNALETDSVKVDGKYIQIQYVRTCTNKDTLNFFWEEYLKDAQYTSRDFEDTEQTNFYSYSQNYCMNKYLRKYGYSRLKLAENRFLVQKNIINLYFERYFNYKVTDSNNFIETSVTLNEDYLTKKPLLKFVKMEFFTQDVIKAIFEYQEETGSKVKPLFSYYLKKREDNTWYFACARNDLNNKPRVKVPGFLDKLTALKIERNNYLSNYRKIENDSVVYHLNFNDKDKINVIKIDKRSLEVFKKNIKNPSDSYLSSYPMIDNGKYIFSIYGREQVLILYPERDSFIIIKKGDLPITDLILPELKRRIPKYSYAENPSYYLYTDRNGVYLYDKKNKKEKKILDLDFFGCDMKSCFSNKGQQVAFYFVGDEYISNLFLYDISKKNLKVLFNSEDDYGSLLVDSLACIYNKFPKTQIYNYSKGMLELDYKSDDYVHLFNSRDIVVFGSRNNIHVYHKKKHTVKMNIFNIEEDIKNNDYPSLFEVVDVWDDGRILIKYFGDRSDVRYYITKESYSK